MTSYVWVCDTLRDLDEVSERVFIYTKDNRLPFRPTELKFSDHEDIFPLKVWDSAGHLTDDVWTTFLVKPERYDS